MEIHLFDQVGELARALVPPDFGELRCRSHRRGVKVWFDTVKPGRFHYEAQVIPARLAPEPVAEDATAIEVGFHAEHRDEQRNTAVIEQLVAEEKAWRRALGDQAEAGLFLGNDHWGRLSETWIEADLEDPDLAFELAGRLADYIQTIEPLFPTGGKAANRD